MNSPVRYKTVVIDLNSTEKVYNVNTFLPSDAEEITAIKVSSTKPVRVALNCDGGHNFLNMDFLQDQTGADALSFLDIRHPFNAHLPITGYVLIQANPDVGTTRITFKYKAKP